MPDGSFAAQFTRSTIFFYFERLLYTGVSSLESALALRDVWWMSRSWTPCGSFGQILAVIRSSVANNSLTSDSSSHGGSSYGACVSGTSAAGVCVVHNHFCIGTDDENDTRSIHTQRNIAVFGLANGLRATNIGVQVSAVQGQFLAVPVLQSLSKQQTWAQCLAYALQRQ